MAESFLKILIQNLSCLLEEEIGVIMGVEKEMKKLQSTLTAIQSVLEDAEANRSIHNWLSNLNAAAFEIEDILDECTTEASKSSTKSKLKKILLSRKIGRRIKEMAARLADLAAERRSFHFCETLAPPSSDEVDCRRETGSILIEPDHVYGRDEDREKIVDLLVNRVPEDNLSVLPIIGVGGLGKTTLAQLVFNDERVSRHFEPKLWICVSDNFCLKSLIEAMIESATGGASNLSQLDALQRHLREILDQRRYLIVLDDVWEENQEDWVRLKSILACGSKGASVVVTTRLRKVAEVAGTLPTHPLKGLSEEDLWSLFKLRAFGRESGEHPDLEAIGRQIVSKCGGVPLAVKALGGLLRFKRREKEWIRVRESEMWEEETIVMPALRLSYHHLPLQLRQCFAYCAVFPKDSEMEKQDLIFHWIALGCIKSNRIEEVEDVGDRIWNELVLRSFFHEVNNGTAETITTTTTTMITTTTIIRTTVKMHDLVHDLAQSILGNKVPGAGSNASTSKVREVRFTKYSWDYSSSSISHRVTTLSTIMNYSRLRILKLNWARVENLPNAIGKLKHLRYLDLTSSQICSLPPNFCNLRNLEILILNECVHLESLPKNIKRMRNLRHIFLDGCSKLSESDMPCGIKELTRLKTLSLFVVGNKVGNQLDQLEELNIGGRLEIRHLERTKNRTGAKLVDKPNLVHLVLNWGGESTMDDKVLEGLEPHSNLKILEMSGFKGSYIPLWMKKMENLTHISIQFCRNLSRLPLLGELPHLKSLHLWSIDELEYIVDKNQNSNWMFPSLERLRFAHLPNLKGVVKKEKEKGGGMMMFQNVRELYIKDCDLCDLELDLPSLQSLRMWNLPQLASLPPDMTSLSELVIRHCPNLASLPAAPMPNLTSLAIFDSPQLAARCREEKGEDWDKIAHIPHLLIR